MNQYTTEEIKKHNSKGDCWIIINNTVYDVSDFLSIHPGGPRIILTVGGSEATEYYDELHHPDILREVGEEYIIGNVVCAKL
jgi:cytochrome b involved in lipid metabolism